ncbi:unnamed protein product [Amoebophrya sp. A25]|nr:unnamed protein product [Amoebophrya sp. A25]|eukprot:GSA25T00005320001.1
MTRMVLGHGPMNNLKSRCVQPKTTQKIPALGQDREKRSGGQEQNPTRQYINSELYTQRTVNLAEEKAINTMRLRTQKLTHLRLIPIAVVTNLLLVGTSYGVWDVFEGHDSGTIKQWTILAITITLSTALSATIEDVNIAEYTAAAAARRERDEAPSNSVENDVGVLQQGGCSTSYSAFNKRMTLIARHGILFIGRLLFGFITVAIGSLWTWAR